MKVSTLLICVAAFAAAAHAADEEPATLHATPTAGIPVAAGFGSVAPAGQRELLGSANTAMNWTLPREDASSFKSFSSASNPQRQAWCVQQSQVRPEGTNLFRTNERQLTGCYDQGKAMSGRDLLIHSALQMAVRGATSIFSD